jgi:putrescine transport system permease protein
MKRLSTFLLTVMCLGYAYLYAPIITLIVFSFNKSRLVTVWGGFSTVWYGRLFENTQILEAAWLSLRLAVISATVATILGTLAGIALVRFGRFIGRTMLSGLITTPLVMPEVLTGVSMLMLFLLMAKWIGWPSRRGFSTLLIAHITFSMTYVTTVITSRLSAIDVSIEEAAQDLGSTPWQVLQDITLPVIAPAILSGWLLAFTISLDDVVITSFTNGPGYNTLPMLVWAKVRLGVTPDINALGSLIVAVVAIGVTISSIVITRNERRRERDIQAALSEGH